MNKIIVVDDHALFREGIKLLIENEKIGEVIAEAENGAQFLELLRVHNPDLVIMDIEMPIMDGLEATKKATSLRPDLKILVLTMLNHKANYNEMIFAGAMGFVLKTSGKDEFEKAINTVIGGESYFSPQMLRQIILNEHNQPQAQSHTEPTATFTAREKEVLQLLCEGFSVLEVADKLFLSAKTIETHRSQLLKKTKTRNTINLLLYAIKNNLVLI